MFCVGAERPDPSTPYLDRDFVAVVHAAKELSADCAGVLLLERARLDLSFWWPPEANQIERREKVPEPLYDAFLRGGVAESGSLVAQFLQNRLAPASCSFLLLAPGAGKSAVTIVFGFRGAVPPNESVPAGIAERLHPVALAAWSARKLAKLHDELRIANRRLAERKLVERAKALLQAELAMDEPRAYEYLRQNSRRRRITIAKLAEEVLRQRDHKNT